MSRVGFLSMLTSLSEIERKWFVSVRILEKVDEFEPQHIYSGYGDHNAGDNHFKETFNGLQVMHVL